MTALLVRGVRVVDPFAGTDSVTDVCVDAAGQFARPPARAAGPQDAVDGRGLWLVPRVADLHVHFREPGQQHKEDIASGSRAAAAGGVSVVGVMPNTTPVIDRGTAMAAVLSRVAQVGLVSAWGIGAVSVGSRGQEAADWEGMRRAGARAFSDDGHPVASSRLMAAALAFSAQHGTPVIQHLEDPELAHGGMAHDGPLANRLGLAGMPAAAESVMAWRDVGLLRAYGGRLHFAHCSVPDTLEALAWSRSHGAPATGEAAPHHLLLTDAALAEWHPTGMAKVNPPLRPAAMREALRQAVQRGVVTVVASDHAPHAADEKARPFDAAPFGISGIETLLGVLLTVFHHERRLTPLALMRLVTRGPHEVVGESYAGVVPGSRADFTLIDPGASWRVDPDRFQSRGTNTPLAGQVLYGRVVATVQGGRFTFREGQVVS